MRALLLHHPYVYPRFEQNLVARIAELAEFDVAAADLDALECGEIAAQTGPLNLSSYDAIVVFVAFKRLRAAATLSWGAFRGLRLLMDHDVIQNYSSIFDTTLRGAWPSVFRRHRFDAIVTSGRAVRDRLAEDGVATDWVPKGFEASLFSPKNGARKGIATYGSAYACRQVAERAVRDARLPLTRLPPTPYPRLGATLNRFLACMAISSDIEAGVSLERAIARDVPLRPGLEPMAKFFEAAGAGCCPVADDMDDLRMLGFRDGETALTFRTHAELVEKLQATLKAPDTLRTMGLAAALFAHAEHTWAHRARALREVICERLRA